MYSLPPFFMKNIILVSTLVLLLSACTWWGTTKTETPVNPYPSIPLSGGADVKSDDTVAVGANFSAKGTEPFWSVEITANETTLSRPGEKDVVVKKYDTRQTDKWAIISIKDMKWEFFVTLTKGSCSDGMSDIKYAYNATVLVGAETLTGCAIKK